MTNHPRRSMRVEVLHDTLITPSNSSRRWSWDERVTVDGRAFVVSCGSMTGAFDGCDSRRIVEAYIAGTLKSQNCREITE